MIPHGNETAEERRKRRWKERSIRWYKKLGSPEKVRDYHRAYLKNWASIDANRIKQREYRSAWEKRNPDKVREKSRRHGKARYWRQREKSISAAKSYYRKHRERILEKAKLRYVTIRESRLNYLKKWQKSHPEKATLYNIKRRALELSAEANLILINRFVLSVKGKKTVRCYYCNRRILSRKCHFDHIIPLSKGGSHSAENLCVSCPKCNLSKSSRLIPELKLAGQQLLNL